MVGCFRKVGLYLVLSRFVRLRSRAYALPRRCRMHHRKPTRAETPIERIYREETGRKMPQVIKRILLRKPAAKG